MNAVRSIRFRVVGVLAVVAALLAGAMLAGPATAGSATASGGLTATVSSRPPATRSGLLWPSGVYLPTDDLASHNAFGAWRGARTDVVVTYSGRAKWADIDNPAWLYNIWKKAPQTLVISAAPFPDLPTMSLAACARGSYDRYWKRFGTGVARAGLANRTVVRLAWEFNGDWNPWSAFKPAEFVGCWRRIFTAAESTAPALRWDWTVNRGASGAPNDARLAWPGKRYVDFVGIDSYDGYPPVTSEAGWKVQYAGPYGLKFWADFARRKGKRLSVPEWGLYPGTGWAGHNGGDNRFYIAKMFGFFRQQGNRLAYEAYFNNDDPSQAGALKLNPIGAAEYRRQIARSRARR